MPLSTVIENKISFLASKAFDLDVLAKAEKDLVTRLTMTTGVAAGQADRIFLDERTLGASANEDLDLVGTTLLDVFGDAFSVLRVKALHVRALPGNSNNVVVGAAAATQWAAFLGAAGTMTLRPGTAVTLQAGAADATCYVSAAGATDLLRIANSAGGSSVTYQIVIIGASA